MDNQYLNYKYLFHKYFLLIIFTIFFSIYLIKTKLNSDDRIIEQIIFLSIFIILVKYNNIAIDKTNDYYFHQENLNNFTERLIKFYENKAKEVRVDEYFFMNANNILNKKEFKLFFVIKFKNITEIFWQLEFVKFYDEYIYIKILHFTELFLYIYYHSITKEKSENCHNCYDNCKIIRMEVEKMMNGLTIDLPKSDKTTKNIDKILYVLKKKLLFIYDSKLLLLSKYSNKNNLYDLNFDIETPSNLAIN